MTTQNKIFPKLTSAAEDDQFGLFLNKVKRANNRTELLSVFSELPKFLSAVEPSQLYLLTQTFLRRSTPPIFGYITETEFNTLFRDTLFLRSPNSSTSLWALICFLSQCDDGGPFQFSKCIALLAEVQCELLRKALTNGQNSGDAYQFAFALSSFASRVYNFFGDNKSFHLPHFSHHSENSSLKLSPDAFDSAAAIVANFEKNLLSVLLEVTEKPPSQLNMAMVTHILMEYGTASAGGEEFVRQFFSTTLCNTNYHSVLRQIFVRNSDECFQRAESRRNWEAILRIVVAMSPNGQSLQFFFADSINSDEFLRRFLIERASLMPSSADRRPRNSEKVADFLALYAPTHSLTAFQTHVQFFIDRCKVVEMMSLHSHFLQSLTVVDFARRLDSHQRRSVRDQLMFSLVPIVPQMIEIADCSRRQIGMLMAEVLFNLFEFPSPPQFDYDENEPMLREFRTALQQQPNQNSTKKNEENKAKTGDKRERKRCPADARVAVLLDSDDDEEVERNGGDGQSADNECDYEEEAAYSSADRPVYLRDCLEILSLSNTNDQTVRMRLWVDAFCAIPQMLRKKSIGWNTLGEDLMETILQLDNRYNLHNFMEIRAEILKLLLAQSPELVSNAFRKITSRCCPMSRRFLLLSAVVDAAKMLANGNGEVEFANENTTKIEQSGTKKQIEEKGEGKVIRRSAILQKQDRKLHENGFSRVAPQFVFPLLHFNQFDLFCDASQSNVFLGKLALALGQLINCAAHSPSILCILSYTFVWLAILRRFGGLRFPFVRRCCICVYLAICDSMGPSTEVLREHFADELRDCQEWLEEITTDFTFERMDETFGQSIGLLSMKIVNILRTF